MPAMRVPELVIPSQPWPAIRSRLARMWIVKDAPHHSIIGQVGSGKSYLCRYGILDVCQYDRVLFIDAKGDDPTIRGLGKVVNRFPSRMSRAARKIRDDDERQANWFRLVASQNWDRARDQVGEALEEVMKEGDWIVVIDELRYITDVRAPGLNLAPQWEAIMLRGRSRGIGMVNLTQEPRWVRGSFYTQQSFFWVSRIEDEASHKRISEIGASRGLMLHLPTIPKRLWVYTDNLEADRYWALTSVPG